MNIYYCDGSTYKNGREGQDSSCLVLCPDGEIIRKYLGDCTINEAELSAVEVAVERARSGDCIYTDSQIVYNWIMAWKDTKTNTHVKHRVASLVPYARAKNLSLVWIRRDENLAGLEIENNPFYTPYFKAHRPL